MNVINTVEKDKVLITVLGNFVAVRLAWPQCETFILCDDRDFSPMNATNQRSKYASLKTLKKMMIFDYYEEDIKSNDVSVFFVFPKLLRISLAKIEWRKKCTPTVYWIVQSINWNRNRHYAHIRCGWINKKFEMNAIKNTSIRRYKINT